MGFLVTRGQPPSFQVSSVHQALTPNYLILRGKRGDFMRTKRGKAKPIVYENAPEHPYKKYESHPFWKLIDKEISDLVENQDLVEREARPYIVGYLCKILLQPRKGKK